MSKNTVIAFVVLIVIAVISTGTAVKLYLDLQTASDPQAAAEAEVQGIVEQVAEIMVLPANELPTIATVVDPEKIKDQPFFANAEKDDKVLIYTTAKKAILWRPSENRIIEVSALNIPTPQNTAPAIETEVEPEPEPMPIDTTVDNDEELIDDTE